MAPLAGKPPFATDEPDSYYESSSSSPQRRVRLPPPDNPNKRTSAYNVYDNYLEGDAAKLSAPSNNGAGNRTSGIGAMLMNLGDDSDEDDSDDDDSNPFSSRAAKPTIPSASPPSAVPSTPTSKHAALAAAIAPSSSSAPRPSQEQPPRPSTSSTNSNNPFNSPPGGASSGAKAPGPMNPPMPMPTPQMNQPQNGMPPSILQRPPPGPQPIAAPRPGYPAPIAALNLARPEPIATRGPQNPFDSPAVSPLRPHFAMPPPGSPAPSAATPHPLLPPVTPITPVFIKPAIPAPQSIKFEDGVATPRRAKTIMRGDREETLLPSRGEKGDDFWRRFSIVAKEENRKPSALKESSWLKKMQAQGNKHSRSVWIVGIILIVLIAGGVGFGVYATRNSPDNQAPKILGGSDGKATAAAAAASSASAGKGGAAGGAGAGGPTGTVLHVSPTFTVDRRDVAPEVTGVPVRRREVPVGHRVQKRRLDW